MRLAERLIWSAHNSRAEKLSTFRPLGDGTLTGAADDPIDLADVASVRLAHATAMSDGELAAWSQHFVDYEIVPLFPQFSRAPRKIGPEIAESESIDDRRGYALETFKLRSVASKLGWKRGPTGDGGSFESYVKPISSLGLVAVLTFSGSNLPETNMRAALFEVSLHRIEANGETGPQILLGEAPPVLLSEVWNDYYEIAAAGSGFDPKWEEITPW